MHCTERRDCASVAIDAPWPGVGELGSLGDLVTLLIIMKLQLTVSVQRLNAEAFLAILLHPQRIVTQRRILPSYAVFLTDLLQLPVVLVGQGTGDFWQAFGAIRFVQKVEQIGLERLVWRHVELDISEA